MTVLAIYNGTTSSAAQDAWLGEPYEGLLAFCGDQTTDALAAYEANWAASQFATFKGELMLSIQLIPDGDAGKLALAATGSMDTIWAAIAKDVVKANQANCYVRQGHEFNGGWYAWAAGHDPADFAKAYARFVTVFRANGFTGKFVWCTGCGEGQVNPELCYPGDEYVDIVATDIYNAVKGGTSWNWLTGQPYGLDWLAGFSRTHNKPIAIPEWGAMDDAPDFITNMAAWIAAHPVVWQSYWQSNSGAACSLTDGTKPNSAAAYKAAFGPKTPAKPALTVTGTLGATAIVVPNADGSAVIELSFAPTTQNVTHVLSLLGPDGKPTKRKLAFATATGGPGGAFWQDNALFSAFTWVSKGGTGRVYAAAP